VNYAPSVVLFASIPFCLLVWRNALLYPNVGSRAVPVISRNGMGPFTSSDSPLATWNAPLKFFLSFFATDLWRAHPM